MTRGRRDDRDATAFAPRITLTLLFGLLIFVVVALLWVLPVLLGLGFRVFSVEAASLDGLRQVIAVTSTATAGALAADVCSAHTSSEVRAILSAAA